MLLSSFFFINEETEGRRKYVIYPRLQEVTTGVCPISVIQEFMLLNIYNLAL